MMKNLFVILSLFILVTSLTRAQSVIDELVVEPVSELKEAPPTSEEVIKRIAPSNKIFLISNKNEGFYQGDFISLLLDGKLVARALVAKTEEGLAGIKIVKIYSLPLWKELAPGKVVRVVRGDDSYFYGTPARNEMKEEPATELAQIETEEDLFNENILLNDEVDITDTSKRLLKTDNLLSVSYGQISSLDATGESASYPHWVGTWGYQFSDNVWGEVSYGRSLIKGFPSQLLETAVDKLTARLKYTIALPFDSFAQPYLGYYTTMVNSPEAGNTDNQAEAQRENELVEEAKSSGPVFGVTVLKRLVPGWFIKGQLGTEIMSVGLALEF